MVDVRGDVLRPPHGTTPAAVKANKIQKWVPLRAMNLSSEFADSNRPVQLQRQAKSLEILDLQV